MKKQKKQPVKQTPEYVLPEDGKRLVFDAVTFGALHAIQDSINQSSVEDRTEKAFTRFLSNVTTNDFDMLKEIFIDAYAKAYSEKQRKFQQDRTMYASDMQQIKRWGGFEKAFPILRAYVVRTMGGND